MKPLVTVLLLLSLVSCVAESTLAQSRRKGRGTGAPASFDPAVDRIPPGFRGADIRALYEHFAAASLTQGEFETSVAFEARKRAAAQRLGIDVTRFAIITAEPADGFTYNPDSGAYTLLLGFRLGGQRVVHNITVKGPSKRTRYRGSNAFGVSRTVERVVAVNFDANLHTGVCDIDFPLSPDRARRLKPTLGILYVVSVSSAFDDVVSSSPTLDNPSDVEIYVYGVNVLVHEVWLVDRRTGEVVAKRNACTSGEMVGRASRGGIEVDWTSALQNDTRSSKIVPFDSDDDDVTGDSAQPKAPEVSRPIAHDSPGMTRLAGGVLAGKAIHKPQPAYPTEAIGSGAEGTVVVEVTVDEQGRVSAARAISGHTLLRAAAVETAADWTFSPTELGGRKVRVVGTISFDFKAP